MDFFVIQSLFERHANASLALPMKHYMKDQFDFLGIKTPLRRQLMRQLLLDPELSAFSAERLVPLVKHLWNAPFREYQYLAMDLLDRTIRKAGPQMIEPLENMIVLKSWWDTVDMIAGHLVGKLFRQHPELVDNYVPVWIQSGNLWLQRTVLLFQLSYKGSTDENLLFETILLFAGSKEFFIQKASGWALREYAKTNPAAVTLFVNRHTLPSLTRREALKNL